MDFLEGFDHLLTSAEWIENEAKRLGMVFRDDKEITIKNKAIGNKYACVKRIHDAIRENIEIEDWATNIGAVVCLAGMGLGIVLLFLLFTGMIGASLPGSPFLE